MPSQLLVFFFKTFNDLSELFQLLLVFTVLHKSPEACYSLGLTMHWTVCLQVNFTAQGNTLSARRVETATLSNTLPNCPTRIFDVESVAIYCFMSYLVNHSFMSGYICPKNKKRRSLFVSEECTPLWHDLSCLVWLQTKWQSTILVLGRVQRQNSANLEECGARVEHA